MKTYVVICFFKQNCTFFHCFLFITCKNKYNLTQRRKSMMSNKHLNAESLYLYADHVFVDENWSHEIKNQTIGE